MKPRAYPPEFAITHISDVVGQLAAVICGFTGELEAARKSGQPPAWVVRTTQSMDAIRGNRPTSAPITWDDLRYMLIADLKTCLKHLEEQP